jgi:hypothetical protein
MSYVMMENPMLRILMDATHAIAKHQLIAAQ